jgi:hypothetical protein
MEPPFDPEAELATIHERMMQPISREQIVANELWRRSKPLSALSRNGLMMTGYGWHGT